MELDKFSIRLPEADEKLYLVSRRHVESNEVIFDTAVQVCPDCGVVFVHKEHQEWRCPLGHPQWS